MNALTAFFPALSFRQVLGILGLLLPLVSAGDDFIAGADVSHLDFFASRGVVYRDGGVSKDGLKILAGQGLNCVRLRLFTSSAVQAANDPYNSINNLDYTVPLAVRAKAAGLRWLLDFHYSDTWADPGHQSKPVAWTNLTLPQLEQRMYDYNSNTIAAFRAAGAIPDYVQPGNEITSGLLWPEGRVGGAYDNQWPQLGRLLNAAIRGIKDAAGANPPKIIIHIDRGGDWNTTQWYFDHLTQQQVEFDIIGESYYPFWHGPLGALSHCLTNAAARYHKPVAVVETAFPWAFSTNLVGIPATPEGQVEYLAALARIVRGVPNSRGAGIVWWGAEYQNLAGYNLAGFENRSFFGSDGSVLPIAGAFGQLIVPVTIHAILKPEGVLLQWSLGGAGMSLTTATNLAQSGNWESASNSINYIHSHFEASVPVDFGISRFYRLEGE